MPNSLVASFAKKSKKSVSEVESLWKSAVDIVKKEYKVKESDKKFYPLVVGVLKKSLGIMKPQNIYKQIIEALYEAKSQQDNIQIPKNWKLNSDGTYDTNASVKLNRTFVDTNGKLKVKFNKAKYAFDCSAIGLTSLEGCPKEVGGQFTCEDNELVSLEGGPKTAGSYNCEFNKLTSLKGAPEKVKYDFNCSNNKTLKSLEGCPKEVGGTFSIAISTYEKPFTSDEIAKLCKVGEDIIV